MAAINVAIFCLSVISFAAPNSEKRLVKKVVPISLKIIKFYKESCEQEEGKEWLDLNRQFI